MAAPAQGGGWGLGQGLKGEKMKLQERLESLVGQERALIIENEELKTQLNTLQSHGTFTRTHPLHLSHTQSLVLVPHAPMVRVGPWMAYFCAPP